MFSFQASKFTREHSERRERSFSRNLKSFFHLPLLLKFFFFSSCSCSLIERNRAIFRPNFQSSIYPTVHPL
ncbi:hypothetical protein HanXRQr2_Chr17g0808381 [Helianthus annuus]|uniref:Uncharacterized protein n=1 Tax=Helianthus annuus TaxID=4232 RepID=A0A9K3DJR5_HELAN|nr:hypothetical protein HanXRQr2_Chr17g0808381 [Helianthus annuus]